MRIARVPWSTPLALVVVLAGFSSARAQQVTVPSIAARPDDVATIDGLIKAYYEVVSGPKGQPRDWARDRTLHIPDARFVAMSVDTAGKPVAAIMSHQQYVERSEPVLAQEGFFESEIHRVTRRFGHIAHVFSTYESRRTADGPVIARGINSLELYWDGARWWIVANLWDQERPGNPIPGEYLPKK
jgi:hypothetical protein